MSIYIKIIIVLFGCGIAYLLKESPLADISVSKEGDYNEDCVSEGCFAYKCFEKTAHCGPNGYLLAYGTKYCQRFHEPDVYDRFDEDGKAFINSTASCLINKMEQYIQKHSEKLIDCNDLTAEAFRSHVDCYLQCDFCHVCKTNKAALFHAYDLTDFFDKLALEQVWSIISKCGIFNCF
ncbi:stanniocalcin family domain-containing protein [Ditylenchus destructor]|uniref:Stanniocalcin family domain-containing protein n=1 Tax=Ditylenchus destructor TaxID=166010 RepID=A0AAD4NFX3_9BILA|nr:stanniocalcin family domain-containing protein [Ditylenchus destructor]